MNQEKNVDVLIKAIPTVLKSIDVHFLFVGSGSLKNRMMSLTKTLGVSGHTTFVDFLDWQDYPKVFALPDVFVMPGESELQSIVTLEAIASGVPAVVSNKGAVRELVSNENGLVFEPQDSDHLAAQLVRILSDDQLRALMKQRCVQLSQSHAMSAVAAQFEEVYAKVTGSKTT